MMDGAPKVLNAFYDLEHGPVSYDFVTWLVRAKAQADQVGVRLHVVVVPKEDGLGGFSRNWAHHDAAAALWRLWHIVVASCPLAGATVTVAPTRRAAEDMRSGLVWWPAGKQHFMGPLIEAARAGKMPPKLHATSAASRYVSAWLASFKPSEVITLTKRNSPTDPKRNSDPRVWGELAAWLRGKGFAVVELEDSDDALRAGEGYAVLDPDLRLALYEQADFNVCANNGPQELLKFSDAAFVGVGQALSDGWKEHFRKYFSMEPGDQLPWSRPDQRLSYEPVTLETLQGEVAGWELGRDATEAQRGVG